MRVARAPSKIASGGKTVVMAVSRPAHEVLPVFLTGELRWAICIQDFVRRFTISLTTDCTTHSATRGHKRAEIVASAVEYRGALSLSHFERQSNEPSYKPQV